jgi:plastocyanin
MKPLPAAPLRWAKRGRAGGLAVALCVSGLLVAACGTNGSTAPTTVPQGSSTTAPKGGAATPASSDTITMKNFAFSPATITVAPGATITVKNDDSVAHTVTSSTQKFSTGDVAPGSSATFKAPETPGTYAYICTIHQFMHGTVVVS